MEAYIVIRILGILLLVVLGYAGVMTIARNYWKGSKEAAWREHNQLNERYRSYIDTCRAERSAMRAQAQRIWDELNPTSTRPRLEGFEEALLWEPFRREFGFEWPAQDK